MNSVLHHLPSPQSSLRRIHSWLKPSGVLIISHEPNRGFYSNDSLQSCTDRLTRWRKATSLYLDPRRYLAKSLRMARLIPPRKPSLGVADEVLRRLEEKGSVKPGECTREWINGLVDFHIPRSTGTQAGEAGFDIQALARETGFTVSSFTDYDYLADESDRSPLHRILDRRLARHHPGCGAHFSAILMKP